MTEYCAGESIFTRTLRLAFLLAESVEVVSAPLFADAFLSANNFRNHASVNAGFFIHYMFRAQPSTATTTGIFPSTAFAPSPSNSSSGVFRRSRRKHRFSTPAKPRIPTGNPKSSTSISVPVPFSCARSCSTYAGWIFTNFPVDNAPLSLQSMEVGNDSAGQPSRKLPLPSKSDTRLCLSNVCHDLALHPDAFSPIQFG